MRWRAMLSRVAAVSETTTDGRECPFAVPISALWVRINYTLMDILYEAACCMFIFTMNSTSVRTEFSAKTLGGGINRPGIRVLPSFWRAASVT